MKTIQTYQQFKMLLETKDVDLANNRVKQAKIDDAIKKNKETQEKLEASKKKKADKDAQRARLEAMNAKNLQDLGKLKQQASQLMQGLAKDQAKM
jgi:hypothetical protein